MLNNINDPTIVSHEEEHKDNNSKFGLNKFDFDLYHEEDDKAEKVIRVKRVSMPNKGEKWKVMSDNKLIIVIEGTKISKKEREFLQTIDGFNFLLQQAKKGIKSLNSLKNEIKNVINVNTPEISNKKATSKKKKLK